MQTLEQIQIMHLCSAVFPTGAFSHSYGFETLFEEDKIRNIEEYRAYLQAVLLSGNAKTDAGIIRFAYEHPEKTAKWDELCKFTTYGGNGRISLRDGIVCNTGRN